MASGSNNPFYGSKEWKGLRLAKLSLNPLCENCEKHDVVTPGEVVDHILEIRDGGELLSMNNLQSLCKSCHSSKTRRNWGKRNRGEVLSLEMNKKSVMGSIFDL